VRKEGERKKERGETKWGHLEGIFQFPSRNEFNFGFFKGVISALNSARTNHLLNTNVLR